MSYNLVDPTTGDLTLVAGRNAIDDETVSETSVWSSQKTSGKIAEKVGKTDIATTIDDTVTDKQIASARAVLRSKSATRMDESVNPENYEVGAWFAEGHDSILLSISNGHPCSEWHIGYVVTGYKTDDGNGYRIILAIAMSGNCYIKVQQWDKWTDWIELATMDKVESKYEEATLDTPVDWNTLNTKARYYFSGGAIMTNAPMQQPFGELVVETAGNGSGCRVQKFFSFDGKLYIRRWSGSNWNEWYRFDGISI